MWTFIQDQILGMKWLNTIIGKLLLTAGLDTDSRIGGSIQFFIYDTIKITVLLCVLIFLISYIQSFFPPERAAWDGDTFLLLLLHSNLHGLYERGASAWGDIFISHFIANGGFGESYASHQYLWREDCRGLCSAGTCHCSSWRDIDRTPAHGRSDC